MTTKGNIVSMRGDKSLSSDIDLAVQQANYAAMEARLNALEHGQAEIRNTLGRLEPVLARMDAAVTAQTAVIPHLATKTDVAEVRVALADKPGKGYLWSVVGVLVASILGAGAIGAAIVQVLR